MKLLLCVTCNDVRALNIEKLVTCRCGASSGRYLKDGITAEFRGDDAYLVGFNNRSFVNAIRSHIKDGDHWDEMGRRFEAFIIPESAETVTRKPGDINDVIDVGAPKY